MIRTIVCSPWAATTHEELERNRAYAQDAMLDSLRRGEAPFLSHLLYTQVLIDGIPEERALGLACETAWLKVADQLVFYKDLGVSRGMKQALAAWVKHRDHDAFGDRSLPAWAKQP